MQKKILITAGPTREYIDPVRYISNDSSGKMGYELAISARDYGADVTLVSGPTHLPSPDGIKIINVTTAKEMYAVCIESDFDIFISAAAVSDFRPKAQSHSKIKKDTITSLELIKNPDILFEIGQRKKEGQIVVGFALENENLIQNAKEKLERKNCDLIVANLPENIGEDNGSILIIDKKGNIAEYRNMNKNELAQRIVGGIIADSGNCALYHNLGVFDISYI